MTWSEIKRLAVAAAAHTARREYYLSAEHGRPVTWAGAIERAVMEAGVLVGPDGRALVTFEAVERQVFPRARDRKT